MNAVSVRPPWGNAVALWGMDLLCRDDLPPRWAIDQRLVIHQGKRWADDERTFASRLAGRLNGRHDVPLDPEGYPNGVLAVARLVGAVNLRPQRADPGAWVKVRARGAVHEALVVGLDDVEAHAASVVERAVMSPWWMPEATTLWLLADVQPFPIPYLCNGSRGLWSVPDSAMDEWMAQIAPSTSKGER